MALPPLTPEQRQAALEKAAASRRERAEVKNRLKNSSASLAEVIKEGETNDVIGKMKGGGGRDWIAIHVRRAQGAVR